MLSNFYYFWPLCWRLVRVVEGARLESVYTSKGYRGFESLSLRIISNRKLVKTSDLYNSEVFLLIKCGAKNSLK